VNFKSPSFHWNERDEVLEVRQEAASDFSEASLYDFTLAISLSEMSSLVRVLAESGLAKSPNLINDQMADTTRHLLSLLWSLSKPPQFEQTPA